MGDSIKRSAWAHAIIQPNHNGGDLIINSPKHKKVWACRRMRLTRRENILDLPVKAMQPMNASAGRIALQKSWEIILLLNLVLVFVQRS